jgi:hypothetical protein
MNSSVALRKVVIQDLLKVLIPIDWYLRHQDDYLRRYFGHLHVIFGHLRCQRLAQRVLLLCLCQCHVTSKSANTAQLSAHLCVFSSP